MHPSWTMIRQATHFNRDPKNVKNRKWISMKHNRYQIFILFHFVITWILWHWHLFYDNRSNFLILFNYLTWVLAVILIHITRITSIRGWHEDVGEGRRVCCPVRTWSIILSWHSLTFFLILFALQIDSWLVISDYWNLMAS